MPRSKPAWLAKTKTPGAWMALAAGWSGGSMLRPGRPAVVAPPPYLTAKAVNAGVLGVLARVDRKARATTLRTFVGMGVSLPSARDQASRNHRHSIRAAERLVTVCAHDAPVRPRDWLQSIVAQLNCHRVNVLL